MEKTGGCDLEVRGQASLERSAMERDDIYDRETYSALSAVIHCQNGDNSDCSNQEAAAAHLGKYKN